MPQIGQGINRMNQRLDREFDRAWAELTAPGARFEVGSIAVRSQTLRSYSSAPGSVRDFWLATANLGDRTYLVYGDERITYAQAHLLTGAIAGWLFKQGVRRGDRVAIAMRNYPEWLLIYWACLATGVVAVGMNAWWTAHEMSHAISDSAPSVIFCDAERLGQQQQWPQLPGTRIVAVRTSPMHGATPWSAVVAEPAELPPAAPEPDDDASIFYTSGTTGVAKGAQMTHRGCINNYMNMAFAYEVHALADARARGQQPADPSPPVALVTTPLFHVTANNCSAYAVTAAGGTLVLMHKWDAGDALRIIEAERVTSMSGAPTIARELMRHSAASTRDISSLSNITGGGAQLPPDLVLEIASDGQTRRASTGYGMTEACGTMTAIAGELFILRPDSCGRMMPTFEAKLIDDAGAVVPAGAVGELCVKGAGVIKGYLNRPEDTAQTIVDGWLHTGDIARIDEQGYVFILDRKKDMVLRGGENVYCAEVEGALFRHAAVAEACVFGVPDARLGEEVGAAVVLAVGQSTTAEALREHLSEWLARYKVPRYLWIREQPLPRGASGKFLRRELRSSLDMSTAG